VVPSIDGHCPVLLRQRKVMRAGPPASRFYWRMDRRRTCSRCGCEGHGRWLGVEGAAVSCRWRAGHPACGGLWLWLWPRFWRRRSGLQAARAAKRWRQDSNLRSFR
jgi:hypothetical protein